MSLTDRETWTLIHGLVIVSLFLLAFAGGLAGLWSFRPGLVTTAGIRERLLRLRIGTTAMALLAWCDRPGGDLGCLSVVPREDA